VLLLGPVFGGGGGGSPFALTPPVGVNRDSNFEVKGLSVSNPRQIVSPAPGPHPDQARRAKEQRQEGVEGLGGKDAESRLCNTLIALATHQRTPIAALFCPGE
jgi:hypothetical protein